MENIILTSTGFANPKFLEMTARYFDGGIAGKKAAVITTASADKERNYFAILAHAQLSGLGFESVVFFDIEKQDPRELLDYDCLYVNGGNTYYLLHFVKTTGFDRVVEEFVRHDGLYIGVSAGSLIAGASIGILDYTHGDPNEIGLTDFSALKLTRRVVEPHYIEEEEDAIRKYEEESGAQVIRLKDGMAWVGELGGRFHVEYEE